MGFEIKGKENVMRWWKYVFFKNGISPREFRKNYTKDIIDCIDINNAINEKGLREAKIRQLMASVRF